MRKVKFVKHNIYHIYNCGVAGDTGKCPVCREENDKWRFLQGLCLFNDKRNTSNILWQLEQNRGGVTLKALKDFIITQGQEREPLVRILTYCAMVNHYHLLVEEINEGGISAFMHKLGGGYTRYFNNKYERIGSLFQGPFQAVLVDNERYLQYLLAYINVINPGQTVEPKLKEEGIKDIEKILKTAEEYLWGAHLEYCGKRNSIIIDKGLLGEMFQNPKEYLDLVKAVLLEKKYQEISHLTLD